MSKQNRMDKTRIRIYKMGDAPANYTYWQTRPYFERLEALESIRNDYIKWAYDSQPGFQRVYRIIDLENLKKNKKAAGRHQDLADLENL